MVERERRVPVIEGPFVIDDDTDEEGEMPAPAASPALVNTFTLISLCVVLAC